MEILEFLGYFGAILVGLILGLIGGGGSILTLPILVYLLGVDAVTATGYSLFIIGITSLVGTLRNAKEKKIDLKIGLLFTIPTLLSLYFTRLVILPSIPIEILSIGDLILMKPMAIMILFAAIMLLASYSMIKGRKDEEVDKKTTNFAKLSFVGLGVGLLSGLVGAGGGFIITPALVFFAYLPMKN
ncbi:sulfite exporter TauE/SafE family protein, partial [Crocinitomicaceae bacterium]|nr:sulfite exporter TauE/SafE family protein [Crocinitomicaceae bacterium]